MAASGQGQSQNGYDAGTPDPLAGLVARLIVRPTGLGLSQCLVNKLASVKGPLTRNVIRDPMGRQTKFVLELTASREGAETA